MNARTILALSTLPAQQSRALIRIICGEATPYERTRKNLKSKFKGALNRVLNFAKHETMRKLHRYMYNTRPLKGAADSKHPGATVVGFDLNQLQQDLQSMFHIELPTMLTTSADDTLESLGYRDPWTMPAQQVLDYIASRQNLLSGISDDVFTEIQKQLTEGLNAGESLDQLSQRISDTFDQIDSGRADVIADNETAAAYSFASNAAAQAAGIQYKKWLHGATSKVPRPYHVAIDGLVVPFDEPFPGSGDPELMYPHDDNGSPEDIINCSCISIPATEEEFNSQ